jgi:hypothetical protein
MTRVRVLREKWRASAEPSALAAAEYRPCFVTARRMRSMPSAVLGPVLSPPWFLQRVCL